MTEHYNTYEAIAQQIGIDKLRKVLETATYNGIFRKSVPVKGFPEPAKMAELARANEHLNNWPLAHWDAQDTQVRQLAREAGIKSWSLSDTVCTLKHVARYHYNETLAETAAKQPKPEPMEAAQVEEREPGQTIEQFISKHGLGFEYKRVESRPDGLMDSEYMTRHFRVRIHRFVGGTAKANMSVYFSQGSGHTADPTLADVLGCLASDASGYEESLGFLHDDVGFKNWASDYRYDTDSRKAEKTYKAIKRQAEQLKRTLGQAAYEELLYNTERQ